jgi:tetratricopeptide (TPR) repeat protein
LYYYGWLLLKTGDHAKAVTLGQQTLELSASLNDHLMMAQSLNLLGLLAMNTGPLEQAHAYFEQALKLSRGAGVQRNIMIALNNLGEVARLRGDYRRALQRYEQAMQLAQETSNPWFQRVLLTNQGSTYIELGEYQRAETALQHAIRMTEAEGRFAVSEAHRCLAELRLAQRNVTEALIEAQEALRLAEAIGDQEMIGGAWRVLGLIAAHTGNHVLVEREPHTPSECFEASLRAFNAVKLEAERARTLRAWAHYEQTHPTTNPDAPSGNTFWNEAREIFMRLGMTHELEKMKQA